MTIIKQFSYFLWYFIARFLPGHGHRSILGKIRNKVALLCLSNASRSSNIGQMVDFGNGKNIKLGDHSGIGQYSIVKGGAQISIGDNVTMGPRVMILSSTHDSRIVDGEWTDVGKSSPIHIGNFCFIGAGAIILAGVKIGDQSIIAAGSVVTREIPSCVFAGGVPARVIRKLESVVHRDDEISE